MTHVAITGASAGIGAAIAREYAKAGATLTLVARRRDLLDAVAAACGKAHVIVADLGADGTSWIAEAERVNGPIDVLVNNAGVQIVESVVDTDLPRAAALLALDLTTPLAITRTVLPGMLERKRGTIVDIASVASIAPTPGMYWYNAAKAGLAAASESLRGELRKTGVHVVTVYPGPVDTDMGRAGYEAYEPHWSIKIAPLGDAATLARRVKKAVDKRRKRVIYPRFYALARHFPNLTRFLLDRVTPPVRPRALRGPR